MKSPLRSLVLLGVVVLLPASGINAQQTSGGQPHEIRPAVGTLSEEVVRARLAAMGYGAIENIQRVEHHFVVETTRNGKPISLQVDALTGQVTEKAR